MKKALLILTLFFIFLGTISIANGQSEEMSLLVQVYLVE